LDGGGEKKSKRRRFSPKDSASLISEHLTGLSGEKKESRENRKGCDQIKRELVIEDS